MARRFHLVDVFAERRYAGNQLAVVVGAEDLSDETLQQLAAETNYSETTFVNPAREPDDGYRVRIFTPAREIAFAGHPILGTAWVVRRHVARDAADAVRLNLAVGQIPVTFEASADAPEVAWFLAPPILPGPTRGQEQKFVPLAREGYPPLVYLFCRETHHPGNDLCARFFFDAHGVREDPATGNATAFLGAYLLEHRFLADSELDLRIEQGYEIRRPSLIMLRARMTGGSPEIRVGGQVIATMQGDLI